MRVKEMILILVMMMMMKRKTKTKKKMKGIKSLKSPLTKVIMKAAVIPRYPGG